MDSPPDRFRIERPGDDFPFYDGRPVALTPPQWWFVMAALVAGYLALTVPVPGLSEAPVLRVILFVTLPLGALRIVAGDHWKALFRRPQPADVAAAVGAALIYILVTFTIGLVLAALMDVAPNPGIVGLASAGAEARVIFFVYSIAQLFGEELLAVLPFLALLTWLTGSRGMARRRAVAWALVAASVIFALAHLPTYGWNLVQVLSITAVARLILFLPYLVTKNILACTLAHILADWTLFAMAIVLADLVAAG